MKTGDIMGEGDFAISGAPPAFGKMLPAGQRYFPSWERYTEAFRGIFERQYYTEYGPLNRQLEPGLQAFLGVKHAICVTNETVGLMMVASALELRGKVILPRNASLAAVQSVKWAGLEPVYCDVDMESQHIDAGKAAGLIDSEVSAILGAHLWGGACDVPELARIAESTGVQLYFDAAHAFGCAIDGIRIGRFGRAEVFSFHQDNIINAGEGGCICTNDDELAARLRTMRSSAGVGKPVEVTRTVNGRMSEAQCALALLGLEDYAANRERNEMLHRAYATRFAAIPGLHLLAPGGVSASCYQHAMCKVDENGFGLSAGQLALLLRAENIGTEIYADCIRLPLGALVSPDDAGRICDLLARAQRASLGASIDAYKKGLADRLGSRGNDS